MKLIEAIIRYIQYLLSSTAYKSWLDYNLWTMTDLELANFIKHDYNRLKAGMFAREKKIMDNAIVLRFAMTGYQHKLERNHAKTS